jgi:large subunit ribosomal protein L25
MAVTHAPKQQKAIDVQVRKDRGSRKAQEMRAQGKIPGVIYGLGKEPVSIVLPGPESLAVLQSGSHIMEVALEGKAEKMLIQEVQYDYLQANLEHIDLLRIDPKKKVHVKVALEFRGTPKGAKEGGILETQTTTVEVEVSPLHIPDSIRVNVENMELHDILHAKEVVLPEGVKLLDYPEKIICQVRTVKEEVVAVAIEVGPTEPEVIGKKKEEEGAEGAAAGAAAGKAPAAAAKAPAAAAAPAAKK